MRFAALSRVLLAATPLVAGLGGCGYVEGYLPTSAELFGANRAEFAAPQSRWPDTLPSPVAADSPPPPRPIVYCYRTLAQVECYNAPDADRASGLTGVYPTPGSAPY
jgi:hypothetical protein